MQTSSSLMRWSSRTMLVVRAALLLRGAKGFEPLRSNIVTARAGMTKAGASIYPQHASAAHRCALHSLQMSEPLPLLLTFDLDDTLWPTKPVIEAANTALLTHLEAAGVETTSESIKTRMKFARTMSSERLTYRKQRTLAIEQELQHQLIREGMDPTKLGNFAELDEEADLHFEGWLYRRHLAASENLYRDVVPALERIRTDHGTIVLVGAVTNGCGNALRTPALATQFDFSVSAEDDDVFPERKPSPRPFEKAKAIAGALLGRRQAFDAGEPEPPLVWVHVGKDLVQDVAAARAAGARAVWVRPSGFTIDKVYTSDFYTASFSEAQLAEKREACVNALEAADATIDGLDELPTAIAGIVASVSNGANR